MANVKLKRNRCILLAVLIVFMVLWFFQVIDSGWCHNETSHIPAGLYALETGRMDAYRVNPPLPRMIAAIPLLMNRPNIKWGFSESPYLRIEHRFADRWLRDNAESLPRQLFLTRAMTLLFYFLGLWSIVRWAKRMYGDSAAILAAMLWLLSPDVLTYSSVVAPDLPAAATGLYLGYLFWDWLGRTQRPFPWPVAAALALAVLCKFSWLFLFAALPLLTLLRDVAIASPVPYRGACKRFGDATNYRDTGRLLVSFSLTILLINWSYGFDGSFTSLRDFEFISESLSGEKLTDRETGNRFCNAALGSVPVPLPREMVRGIDYLKWEFERGKNCYLNGQWQHGGWWYFYLYAVAVKMPLGFWILIVAGLASMAWDQFRNRRRFPLEWLPILIAIIFICLISSQTGFTHHVRYVLPAYGFLFLTASRIMAMSSKRLAIALVAICLSGTLWFHATHLGLAHTFFNPLAGGPNNGWRHLSFSNVDWGQSTYRMVDWVNAHPAQRPMTVLFRSSFGEAHALLDDAENVASRVDWDKTPGRDGRRRPRSGWYLLSSFQMTREPNEYFRSQKPVAQPWPDVLVFYVHPPASRPQPSGERTQWP